MPRFHRLELLRRALRDRGAGAALSLAGRQARDAAFGQHRLLFAMTGEKAARIDPAPGPGVSIRRVAAWAEMDAAERAAVAANPRQVWWDMERVLACGSVAWIARVEGAPLSFALTRTGPGIDAYFFPMTERCALISHCVTLPEARGRGLYAAMLRHVCRALAEEGRTRIYIDCSDTNFASERGILSAGFLPIGRGIHRRSGALVWFQRTPPSVSRLEAGAREG